MTNSPSNLIGQHGAITDRYEDYTRAQMLSALAQLEMVCYLHMHVYIIYII